ncbi:MAG: TrpR-like protein [Oscillospiraceae bacterium]|nr:TrpR-like protein [Oscillospiraceae bacterium]
MPKPGNKERSMALYESILELNSIEECCAFFDDLCTVGELRAMEQRYDVALLLDQGLVYTEILEKTGASSATISRVNRIFSFGTGGFRRMIERRKERKK